MLDTLNQLKLNKNSMKYKIEIEGITTVDEIKEYWSNQDYIKLLEIFNYPDAEESKPENLRELLFMAISDFEPAEAAKLVLEYKLGDQLSDGQIEQIANDMLIDTVCEEYPEMELQSTLFHITQLLFKAYNGKFPSSSATIINCSITSLDKNKANTLTKAMILQLFNDGLSDRNIVKRLFAEQMEGKVEFAEAENIIWDLEVSNSNHYKFVTSGNLIKKEEVIASEWESNIEETEA